MNDRRNFIKKAGLAMLPGIVPFAPGITNIAAGRNQNFEQDKGLQKYHY